MKSYLCHPKEFRRYPMGNGERLKDFKKRNNMVLLAFSSSVEDGLQETGEKINKRAATRGTERVTQVGNEKSPTQGCHRRGIQETAEARGI